MACARGETVGIAGDFAGVPTFQAGDLKPADFGSNERAVPTLVERRLPTTAPLDHETTARQTGQTASIAAGPTASTPR